MWRPGLVLLAVTALVLFHDPPCGAAECAATPAGMVSWWRGEGTAADDLDAHHGTPVNGAGFATGHHGPSMSFDGLDDGFVVTPTPTLQPTAGLSLEAWILTPGIPESAYAGFIVACSGANGLSGYELLIGTPSQNGCLRFTLMGGEADADLFGNQTVTDNQFHHVAATYDGSVMRIYRDGVLDVERPVSVTLNYGAGDLFWIGRRSFVSIPGHFPGLIDELSVYHRALTADEIRAIHGAGSAGKCGSLRIAALPQGAVRLTWPTNAVGFLLETNDSLAASTGWGVLTSIYPVLDAEYAVTNDTAAKTRFYRLRQP